MYEKTLFILDQFGTIYGDMEAKAYTVTRAIATYGAIYNVLDQLFRRLPDFNPRKVLDFGCGPGKDDIDNRNPMCVGTTFWAMPSNWSPNEITAVDNSPSMLHIFDTFLTEKQKDEFKVIKLQKLDLNSSTKADLVIASYVLSDLQNPLETVDLLWENCNDVLVLIDRGTSHGFDLISKARQRILSKSLEKSQNVHVIGPVYFEIDFLMDL